MNYRELSILFEKLVKNECTEKEADEVLKLLSDRSYDSMFRQLVEAQFHRTDDDAMPNEVSEETLHLKLEAILNSNLPERKVGKINFTVLKKWYIAATVLLFLGVGAYVFKNNTPKNLAANSHQQKISFGGNKATLTLSNGKIINLEDATNGAIAAQSNFTIKKTKEGVVVYQANTASGTTSSATAQTLFNTITTPVGGQYEVILPDGSKVWLNAASSIKFPTQFAANERLVELTGEAYFEVMKAFSPQKSARDHERLPFVVLSGRQKIQVLGTRFNVNDYREENTVKTTLLQGSVKVNTLIGGDAHSAISAATLRPGQQSDLDGGNFKVSAADTASAVAWKAGFFQFDNEDIYVVMRKISRWYNVDVEYHGDMRGKVFSGVISKYTNVTEVLKMLQLTGFVSFTINNRKITVS
jgi:ferric-dicitrate binding protein FerR (iron transport regulator)